jgi:hypothetical protein
MLSPLVSMIMKRAELRNPKSYKVTFAPWYTVMGKAQGEGWYIIAPRVDPLGPIASQEEAENLLIAALEQILGKPMQDTEKEKAREHWKKV